MAPGGRWSGRYLVADIDDFVGKCLAQEMDHTHFKIRPHSTEVVKLGKQGIHFPCKDRYNWYNNTLEGREAFWQCDPTKKGKPSLHTDTEAPDDENAEDQQLNPSQEKVRNMELKGIPYEIDPQEGFKCRPGATKFHEYRSMEAKFLGLRHH